MSMLTHPDCYLRVPATPRHVPDDVIGYSLNAIISPLLKTDTVRRHLMVTNRGNWE